MTGYTLFGQTGGTTLNGDTTGYTFTMQFSLSQALPLTGVWWYSAPGATVLPGQCGVFDDTTQDLAASDTSPSWSGDAGSGWVRCPFDGSVTLEKGTAYKVAVCYAGGSEWYSNSNAYWSSGAGGNGLTNGPITAPNSADAAPGQDAYADSSVLTYPTTTLADNYWVDVEVGGSGSSAGRPASPVAALHAAGVL